MKFHRLVRYFHHSNLRQLGRQWLVLVVLLGAITLFYWGGTALAAPTYQTVPPPTPTKQATPLPTATPRSNDDDDEDRSPTATPLPSPTPTPEGLRAVVSVVRLNVRQGPGITFGVVGVVASGQNVRVLARNEAGDWWQICCLPGTSRSGWVASQFLQPSFDLGEANTLIPVADEIPEAPEPTALPTEDPNALLSSASLAEGIIFEIQQDPLYTWQGQEVSLVYQIANSTITDTTNLELRNELPEQLRFVAIEETDGGVALTETTELSTTAFAITWPTLDAGTAKTARVRVQVADDLPDGSVIDNLAVIIADEVAAITGGISIGMPPTDLPDFR
ncbi:MAG TPA: SH3 domain-containing protein [Caldilineaceae bacterium]|nr:SH3 domain-containing protein [Caldilineaceae bacterium]